MIRKATYSDLDSWLALNSLLRTTEPEDPQRFKNYIADSNFWIFFIESGGQVVGKGECEIKYNEGHLYGGVVLPEFRYKGFGTSLFKYRVDFLHNRGVSLISTLSANHTVIKLAEKLKVSNEFARFA